MELQRKAQQLAVTVTGVHSVVLIDNGTVADAIFDIEPDESGSGLTFRFLLPEVVSRNEVRSFTEWLASADYGETVH